MVFFAAIVIVVHVSNVAGVPAPLMREAQSHVEAMFRDIGVTIAWVDDAPSRGVHAAARLIVLPTARGAMRERFDAVLGAASRTPGGLGTAWVFFDRIRDHAERQVVPLSRLLACAIAHELGHVMQAVPGHSSTGVMRGTWTRREYRGAALGRLKFTEAIYSGSSSP